MKGVGGKVVGTGTRVSSSGWKSVDSGRGKVRLGPRRAAEVRGGVRRS